MSNYHFLDRKYGKYWVKLLHIKRENELKHDIREYEVGTLLTLDSDKDYLHVSFEIFKLQFTHNPRYRNI